MIKFKKQVPTICSLEEINFNYKTKIRIMLEMKKINSPTFPEDLQAVNGCCGKQRHFL